MVSLVPIASIKYVVCLPGNMRHYVSCFLMRLLRWKSHFCWFSDYHSMYPVINYLATPVQAVEETFIVF